MNDKTDSSNEKDDLELFRRSVRDARPLVHKQVEPHRRQTAPLPRQRVLDDARVLEDMLSDEYRIADVETGDELFFARAGLQHNVIRKLRRGQYSIEWELDLHGMTVAEARAALLHFFRDCQRHHHARCVRIVHGKGHGSANKIPILKNRLNNWLRQIDDVLAFCSARAVDGGTGAVYVLLKRRR